jgi:hypothetical protein
MRIKDQVKLNIKTKVYALDKDGKLMEEENDVSGNNNKSRQKTSTL